jgi:hypothetical protein
MTRLYCRAEPCPAYRKKEAEPADKPGSVVDSHSSRRYVTATLKQPTRIQRGPRQRIPIWSCSRWGLPCRSVARLAVRSYRTISPLPAFRRRRRRYLSVALSVGLRRPGVTWHLALWSPDFPRHPRRDDATVWPAPPALILAYARPSCRVDRDVRFIHPRMAWIYRSRCPGDADPAALVGADSALVGADLGPHHPLAVAGDVPFCRSIFKTPDVMEQCRHGKR